MAFPPHFLLRLRADLRQLAGFDRAAVLMGALCLALGLAGVAFLVAVVR